MRITIIDGMGGGIGKSLAEELVKYKLDIEIVCIGTNAIATTNMIKGGAPVAATGENAVIFSAERSDIIVGPIGIILANSMYGEVTPNMARAVSSSDAKKVIVPISNEKLFIAGLKEFTLAEKISQAVHLCTELIAELQ